VVYVEGETDQQYLERVLALRFSGRNVVVVRSGGDCKQKLHSLRESLGDLQKGPLRNRLFVIVDSVHPKGLHVELVQMGLLTDNFVVWSGNGIEFLYPEQMVLPGISGSPAEKRLVESGSKVGVPGVSFGPEPPSENRRGRVFSWRLFSGVSLRSRL